MKLIIITLALCIFSVSAGWGSWDFKKGGWGGKKGGKWGKWKRDVSYGGSTDSSYGTKRESYSTQILAMHETRPSSYSAPAPSYQKPSYSAPVVEESRPSSYSAPAPSYQKPSYSAPVMSETRHVSYSANSY